MEKSQSIAARPGELPGRAMFTVFLSRATCDPQTSLKWPVVSGGPGACAPACHLPFTRDRVCTGASVLGDSVRHVGRRPPEVTCCVPGQGCSVLPRGHLCDLCCPPCIFSGSLVCLMGA